MPCALGAAPSCVPVRGAVLGTDWRTQAAFTRFDPDFASADPLAASFKASDAQKAALQREAVWTAEELVTALDAGGSAPVGIGIPNLVGANVTLRLDNGGAGRSGSPVSIDIDRLKKGTLTLEEKAALALATAPGDARLFGTVNGVAANWALGQQPGDAIITRVVVGRTSPLFVAVTGALNVTATQHVFIQSSATDLRIDKVTAGGEVRLTAPGSLFGLDTGVANVVTPGDLRLQGGSGNVAGATGELPTSAFTIQIGGRLITASAERALVLRQLGGDLRFDQLVAKGHVSLRVDAGGLVQGQTTASGIKAFSLTVAVRDAVGTADKFVQVELDPTGPLSVTAPAGIHLRSMGATNVLLLSSARGPVTLQTLGTVSITRIEARTGVVSLFSDGAILDGHGSAPVTSADGAQIVALAAVLRAATGIGTSTDALETSLKRLEARSFASMYAKNFGDLIVGGVDDGLNGLRAAGTLQLTLASTLTVDEAIASDGLDIRLQASEGVVVNRDVTSSGGSITVRAGTFITMADGTTMDAGSGTIDVLAGGDILVSLIRTTGFVRIVTTNGSILDADTTGALDVVGDFGELRASGTIGTAANPLETDFRNTSATSLVAGTGAVIVDEGDLLLSGSISTAGDIVVTAGSIVLTGSLFAEGGDLILNAAGDVTLAEGSIAIAGKRIVITGGIVGATGPGGSTVTVLGTVRALLVDITTGAGNDQVLFSPAPCSATPASSPVRATTSSSSTRSRRSTPRISSRAPARAPSSTGPTPRAARVRSSESPSRCGT